MSFTLVSAALTIAVFLALSTLGYTRARKKQTFLEYDSRNRPGVRCACVRGAVARSYVPEDRCGSVHRDLVDARLGFRDQEQVVRAALIGFGAITILS